MQVCLFGGLVCSLLMITGGATGWWYGQKMAELQDQTDRVSRLHQQLLLTNASLMRNVMDKEDKLENLRDELSYLTNELTEIEALVGLRTSAQAKLSISERLDTAGHTALERTTFLQNVPSGYPLRNRGISSHYGWRKHPVHRERRYHTGIDLRAPVGTPVVATADGVVEYAGFHSENGFGNLIIVMHNFGFRTYYAHLDAFAAKPGDFVRKGAVIGRSGETGMTDGPHLHYEIWHIQRRLNPKPFLTWSLANYSELFEQETSIKWEGLEQAIRLRLNTPSLIRYTSVD